VIVHVFKQCLLLSWSALKSPTPLVLLSSLRGHSFSFNTASLSLANVSCTLCRFSPGLASHSGTIVRVRSRLFVPFSYTHPFSLFLPSLSTFSLGRHLTPRSRRNYSSKHQPKPSTTSSGQATSTASSSSSPPTDSGTSITPVPAPSLTPPSSGGSGRRPRPML